MCIYGLLMGGFSYMLGLITQGKLHYECLRFVSPRSAQYGYRMFSELRKVVEIFSTIFL